MKVKVCGMKHPDNIKALSALPVDYMGFIFYDKSPRYIETPIEVPKNIEKVGVFVNESFNSIIDKVNRFQLKVIQLHGKETPEFCDELNQALAQSGQAKVKLWKVFSIKTPSDFEGIEAYRLFADGYLLDTKGQYYGGNSKKFDWNLLQEQHFSKPVMLSGGIGPEDAEQVVRLYKAGLIAGVDLNSKFEDEPGLKNITLLKKFLQKIKTYE